MLPIGEQVNLPYQKFLNLLEDDLQVRALVTSEFKRKDGAWGYFPWKRRTVGSGYNYRSIYPIETVADIGDESDYDTWEECRAATVKFWTRLELAGVQHIRALSGGKGTHTHVLISDPDYREPFMKWAVSARGIMEPPIALDALLVNPGSGSRMVREFGSINPRTGRRKTLWTYRADQLPMDRDAAYEMQPTAIPSSFTINRQPPGAYQFEISRSLGYPCPVFFDCFDSPDECVRCPINR